MLFIISCHLYPVTAVIIYHLVIVASRTLRRSKRYSVCPRSLSLRPVMIIALLARPAVADCAQAMKIVLMNAGHKRPASSGCGHITERLVY